VGHDHHFLSRLDRVSPEQVELALGLYRDAELVRTVLTKAKLPEQAERVAISMDHPSLGPFLVVARNGHFVTCLGRGMHVSNLPIVTRAELDTIATKVNTLRDQLRRAREATPTDGERARLLRVIGRGGDALTREEFAMLDLWAPMLWGKFLAGYLENFEATEEERLELITGEGRREPNDVLEAFWRRVFGLGHMVLLGVSGEPEPWPEMGRMMARDGFTISRPTTMQAVFSILIRGAWAAAHVGEPLIAAYEKVLADDEAGFNDSFDAFLGLAAIAIKHDACRAPIRKMFARGKERWAKAEKPLEWRLVLGEHALTYFDGPTDYSKGNIEIGRISLELAQPRFGEQSPYRYEKREDVPEDVALTALFNVPLDWHHESLPLVAQSILPYVVRAKAAELYPPRDLARGICLPWERESTLHLLGRFGRPKTEPLRVENRVGRNDPCPCGSGKKYKKCHGQ
jgi:hypothetical protein